MVRARCASWTRRGPARNGHAAHVRAEHGRAGKHADGLLPDPEHGRGRSQRCGQQRATAAELGQSLDASAVAAEHGVPCGL